MTFVQYVENKKLLYLKIHTKQGGFPPDVERTYDNKTTSLLNDGILWISFIKSAIFEYFFTVFNGIFIGQFASITFVWYWLFFCI